MKILLAEDEKDMSSALTAILQHSGYDVDSVYDGQAAMEMIRRKKYITHSSRNWTNPSRC